MLNIEISLFIYMIEMLIAYSVFSRVSDRRRGSAAALLIGAAIFVSGSAVNILFSNTVWINVAYTIVMNFLFAVSCFKLRPGTAAIYSVLMDLLSIIFEFITVFLVSSLIGGNITNYNSDVGILAIESGISKVLYFAACILLLRPTRDRRSGDPPISVSFFLYPMITLIVLLVFWYICAHGILSDQHKVLLADTSLLLLAGTVVLYITFRHSVEKDSELAIVRNENRMLQTEKAYYDIMKHQNDQLMIYAHDAGKHLFAIQSLNNDPAIAAYLEKLLDQLKNYSRLCQSGNKILDVIINKYVTECQMLGIDFAFDVRSCCLKTMNETDLVALLGNLLDNAVEAAELSGEKKVSLESTVRNGYDVIVISNSCDKKPTDDHGGLITTKKNGKYHGYGIKSIRRTLKKYGGDFDYDYDEVERVFTATVMIGRADAERGAPEYAHTGQPA